MNLTSYTLSGSQSDVNFINISVEFSHLNNTSTALQLPSWRPGRYELGNFAKNVRNFTVTDENKKPVSFYKTAKDRWQVENGNTKKIIVNYQYYAAELNAGSSFCNDEMLYVNPVNCCIYIPERINESCSLCLTIPDDYTIAAGKKFENRMAAFSDFHELADTPFICSAGLIHFDYFVHDFHFHVWIQGKCHPDIEKIRRDFSSFSEKQINSFGELPVKEYHFLIHAPSFSFYHGVEHQSSSVNVLGPGYEITNERYVDLLGLCSHELYHSWNIKSIRPAEMFPYDYTKENYFRTGYVAEGVTTYLGDYFLYASGVFGEQQFLEEMSQQLQKHMDNFGRRNYSVAESSFDTWLDGYTPGIPGRKVSIYTEGCLLAFIADILLLKHSKNNCSIHHVMKELYHSFYKNQRGYTENDYKNLLEKYSGISFENYFSQLVNGTGNYLPLLKECFDYTGYLIVEKDSVHYAESVFGFRIIEQGEKTFVSLIHPDGEAQQSGLAINDQVLSVNGIGIKNDLHKWLNHLKPASATITVLRAGSPYEMKLNNSGRPGFKNYYLAVKENRSEAERNAHQKWLNPEF